MKRISSIAAPLLVLAVFAAASDTFAKPTEKSLLEAWEAIQKSDPKTVVFEKLGENRYRFKTKQFPFDGELRVLNLVVDGRFNDPEYGWINGVVELELIGLTEDFMEKHEYSYGIWSRNNRLKYDKKEDRWLTLSKLSAKQTERYTKSRWLSRMIFSEWGIAFFLAVIVFLVVLLFIVAKKSISSDKDIRKKLEEIRQLLESKNTQ